MAELEIKPTARQRMRVIGLAIVATVLAMIQMYLLVGGGQDLFARRTTLTTWMPDASGITTESEVRLSGIRIGTVKSIQLSGDLDPRRSVKAELRILARYLKGIPEDSQTDVTADTLVGAQFIDIAEGKSPLPIRENGVLQSEPVQEAADRADLIRTLQNNLAQVDTILANMSSPDTKIGSFVIGEELYDTMLLRFRGFDQSLHTFLTPQSDLGKAFYSSEMYNKLHDPLVSFDKVLTSIQNGEGTVGTLFARDEQYNNAVRQLTDLRSSLADINAGKGKAGALLHDEESYRQIARLLSDTDAMIASLNAGEGGTGRLLANAQIYESLTGSLHSIELVLRNLREDPRKYLRYKPF